MVTAFMMGICHNLKLRLYNNDAVWLFPRGLFVVPPPEISKLNNNSRLRDRFGVAGVGLRPWNVAGLRQLWRAWRKYDVRTREVYCR